MIKFILKTLFRNQYKRDLEKKILACIMALDYKLALELTEELNTLK